ncbi:MAG: hypothetical protein KF693_08145 [Nitrospira sp.]|nr:hypothetical protein [Nitrospira sp.]
MSAQPSKTYFDYLIGLAAAVTVLGFLINYWNLAGSFASEVWQRLFVNVWFIWLGLGVYVAVRLGRFFRTLYHQLAETIPVRLNELGKRLTAVETDVYNSLEIEAGSRVGEDEELRQDLRKLREDARAEVAEVRRELSALSKQVSEQKEKLAAQSKREPSPGELLASRVGTGMINRARN